MMSCKPIWSHQARKDAREPSLGSVFFKVISNPSKETAAYSVCVYGWLWIATSVHCHLYHIVHLLNMNSVSVMAIIQMGLSAVVAQQQPTARLA